MEYNPLQNQDQTNFEALHAQEFTPMNNIVFHLHPDFKKKKKKKNKINNNNKKASTYQPSQFSGQKGKQTFYFFRPYICFATNKWICSSNFQIQAMH